jgi:hypothetical protein
LPSQLREAHSHPKSCAKYAPLPDPALAFDMVDSRGRPMLHQHKNCGKMFDPVMVCSECGEPLTAKAVHVHPGPGARQSSPVHAKESK